jgi:5-oxoprolinase (ATP-hydrolysing) subunit A
MRPVIDLNADVGEGFGRWTLGDDDALLDVVTSANVACGFHAGDPSIMRRVCARAVERGVRIGAQVGYRDLAGFGRREIDVGPVDLAADVLYQLGALHACATAAGGEVAYLRPHGALYNRVVWADAQAAAVVEAARAFDDSLPVLGLPDSALLRHAVRVGLPTVLEAFADRGYRADGTLVPRSEPGAVLTDEAEVTARVIRMVRERLVIADDGSDLWLSPRSICLHGDTPGAAELARRTRQALQDNGVRVEAFA